MKRLLFIAMLACTGEAAYAADVVKTIGASGADYTTIADWEADLDDGTNAAINTTAYGSGDVAIGELIDANYAATTVAVEINGGSTVGLSQIVLRPSSGNKHDGTFGSGTYIDLPLNGSAFRHTGSVPLVIEDLEFRSLLDSGTASFNYMIQVASTTASCTIQRCLFQCDGGDRTGSGLALAIDDGAVGSECDVLNCVFKNITKGTGNAGIAVQCSYGDFDVYNCTIDGCYIGVEKTQATGTFQIRNCVVVGSGSEDFKDDENYDTASNNISSDGTHGTTTSQSTAELFTDTGNGDYTPLTGSDLIDAGTDLATTPTGVNIDAKQRDRDAEGDTWDVGAIESVSSPSTNPNPITPSIPGGTPDPLRRGPIP